MAHRGRRKVVKKSAKKSSHLKLIGGSKAMSHHKRSRKK